MDLQFLKNSWFQKPRKSGLVNLPSPLVCNHRVDFQSNCDPQNFYSSYSNDCSLPENLDTTSFINFTGPVISENTKAWFGVTLVKMNWQDGRDHCESLRLEMAQVHSSEDNEVIYDMPRQFLRTRGYEVWIGGLVDGEILQGDQANRDIWMWTNDNPICWDSDHSFDGWSGLEPNNAGVEGCLEISWHGDRNGWNDWGCWNKAYVACEFRCLV